MKKRRVVVIVLLILIWIGDITMLNMIEGLEKILGPITIDINLLAIEATRRTVSLQTLKDIGTWIARAIWVGTVVLAVLALKPIKPKK